MSKEINKSYLVEQYMEYVLENGKSPKNVYLFMKELGHSEADFYPHFGNLDGLSEYSIQQVILNTRYTLEQDSEYADFSPREQLLAFYFTLVQNLNLSRSYITSLYQCDRDFMSKVKRFSILRKAFIDYIATVNLETMELPFEKLEEIHAKTKHEIAWLQFVSIFKFWLEDTSPAMEKTDIYIEKSINTGFDIVEAMPFKQIIDLGKFIFKEKMGV